MSRPRGEREEGEEQSGGRERQPPRESCVRHGSSVVPPRPAPRRRRYPRGVIDTHCHLTFPDFEGRVPETLEEARAAGVDGCITVSTTPEDALEALAVARRHERVWSSAGVHPLYSDRIDPDDPHAFDALLTAARDPKCVAWGELGLDNHYPDPPRDLQDRVLERQLEFIVRSQPEVGPDARGLPVIIHCREAFDDLIPRLRESGLDPSRMVFHCFTGTPDDARKVLDFGSLISFTGVVTYRNAAGVAEAARLVPDDRIMVETDAPFLSPEPKRGKRPCVPAYSRHTAEFLAKLRGVGFEDFERRINENTERFFGIPATSGPAAGGSPA